MIEYEIRYSAKCLDCGKTCEAKNAQAWTHQHVRTTGHTVDLRMVYVVKGANGKAKDTNNG